MTDSAPSEIQINIKGPNELKLQINISTDKTVLELKQAIAAQSDVEADRQRLIYSGRVLKDEDPLTNYKIQSTHTIHMVKGVSRPAGGAGASSGPPPQQLPTMHTGQNPHDPLTQLNSHMGFGAMAGFNPFADMGVNPNDPNMLQNMMDSPEFLQQMSSVMSNPAVVDQLIASNPQMAAMGPRIRELFQSERFQQIMSNPEQLRAIMQLSSAMRGNGGGGDPFGMLGGGGGTGSFPAPGVPTTGASSQSTATGTAGTGAGANPFGGADPLASLLGSMGPGLGPGAGAGIGGAQTNPFGDPAQMLQQMQQMQQLFGGAGAGGAGAGANPFLANLGGNFGGAGSPPTPADTRSPEERFEVQLQQLQDMGFTTAHQNVRALLATGGNVHAAIEYILGGHGI